MKLTKGKKNVEYVVNSIPDNEQVNKKLLSLGVYEGAIINIKQFLPAKGPIIINAGTGEVAVSYEIANKIDVKN